MYQRLRNWLYEKLDPQAHPESLTPANKVIAVIILMSAIVAILETEVTIRELTPRTFFLLEAGFIALFSVEYGARFIAAGANPQYRGVRGHVRYFFSRWSLIDLIALLPFILTLGGVNLILVRLFKFLRLVRLLRLGPFGRSWEIVQLAISRKKFELLLSLTVALGLLVLSSSLLYMAEATAQPDKFGSIPRALWWSIATLTTVGYGDVTPVTVLGRIFAGFSAVAGIGLVAMPAGILAAAFSDAFQERKGK
jgi:voltage-gated potassium channel